MRAVLRRVLVAACAAAALGASGCVSSRAAAQGQGRAAEERSLPPAAARGVPDLPVAPDVQSRAGDDVATAPEPFDLGPTSTRRSLAIDRTLTRGWQTARTAHFLFVFAGDVDRGLLTTLEQRAEGLRTVVLEARFPAEGREAASLVIRICKDRDQYHAFGGAAGSAGTFDVRGGELVVFEDATSKRSTVESLQSLVCMAYVHEALGARAGGAWFRHGLAGWAGAHTSQGGRLAVHAPSPQRRRAGELKRGGGAPRLHEILAWDDSTRATVPARAGVGSADLRALCADLVEFLLSSPDPTISSVPGRYFAALARGATDDAALAEAMAGIDLDMLERSWLAF